MSYSIVGRLIDTRKRPPVVRLSATPPLPFVKTRSIAEPSNSVTVEEPVVENEKLGAPSPLPLKLPWKSGADAGLIRSTSPVPSGSKRTLPSERIVALQGPVVEKLNGCEEDAPYSSTAVSSPKASRSARAGPIESDALPDEETETRSGIVDPERGITETSPRSKGGVAPAISSPITPPALRVSVSAAEPSESPSHDSDAEAEVVKLPSGSRAKPPKSTPPDGSCGTPGARTRVAGNDAPAVPFAKSRSIEMLPIGSSTKAPSVRLGGLAVRRKTPVAVLAEASNSPRSRPSSVTPRSRAST